LDKEVVISDDYLYSSDYVHVLVRDNLSNMFEFVDYDNLNPSNMLTRFMNNIYSEEELFLVLKEFNVV